MNRAIILLLFMAFLPSILSAEVANTKGANDQIVTESPKKETPKTDKIIKNLKKETKSPVTPSSNTIITEKNEKKIENEHTTDTRVAKATEWNAYATIAIAILTIILAFETIRLRRIQAKQIKDLNESAIKPKIELFLETNKYAINLLEIHIVNNGNGTANNIKFLFEAEQNESVETAEIIISKITNINFFNVGLRYLGAGQRKKSFLVSALENELGGDEKFFNSSINATVLCEDDLGKSYSYSYTICMSEFKGIRSIGGDPTKEIADNIKKIQDLLSSVVGYSSGKKRIQADIYTEEIRTHEEEEMRNRLKKHQKI